MERFIIALGIVGLLAFAVGAQFSFYPIDNFEDGDFTAAPRWWQFGTLRAEAVKNPPGEDRDLITESCGDYALKLSGQTNDWYIGGLGSDVGVDASPYSRFQIDLDGHATKRGKLKIELFDDDNNNYSMEQDPVHNYDPLFDDRFVAEVNILGPGFSRTSIPFSAFTDTNPGVGDDTWNPDQLEGSGGLLKMQLVIIGEEQKSSADLRIDNILFTH